MSDNGQLKSIIERILRLHEEEDERKADRREVYAEAKSAGFDKTALGAAVSLIRKRSKMGAEEFDLRDETVSLYVEAYEAPSHTHAYARTETPARHFSPERDPQSGHHGSDSLAGGAHDRAVAMGGSEQESVAETQARNEPGSDEAASGGEGLTALPETPHPLSSLARAAAIARRASPQPTQNPGLYASSGMPDLPAHLDRRGVA